jgi:nucleotide-binding universal stress UspA family protein
MYTIRKILCPTDFSVYSKHALEYAVKLADRPDSEITVLHVDEFDVSPLGHFHLDDETVRRYRDLKSRFLKEQMEIFAEETLPKHIKYETRIAPGRAYKTIVEEAEANNFDLILIARHGTTNMSNHLVGSIAERVVRLARCPVLTIRGTTPPGERGIKNILCPTDFSPAANSALSYAVSIAEKYKSKLYIQHISEIAGDPDIEALKKKAPKLEDIGEIEVEMIYDRDIEPNNSIIRFSEDREIDLIVMSTHGQKGLRRVFIGNNTAEVVRKAECPVLTVTHPIHKVVFSSITAQGKVGASVPE